MRNKTSFVTKLFQRFIMQGQTLITADGTTLAAMNGITEIVTAMGSINNRD
jgi:hypothetical protein